MESFLYSTHGSKSWTTMTAQELAGMLEQSGVALLPMGAIERHAGDWVAKVVEECCYGSLPKSYSY